MKRPRIVLDTNVLISAAVKPLVLFCALTTTKPR